MVTINNEHYAGNLLCPKPVDIATCSVFAAICAGFSPETVPLICSERRGIGCPDGKNRDKCGVCGGDGSSCKVKSSKSLATGFIFIILLIIICAFGIGYYLRHRLSQAEDQLSALRSLYEPLQNFDNTNEEPKLIPSNAQEGSV